MNTDDVPEEIPRGDRSFLIGRLQGAQGSQQAGGRMNRPVVEERGFAERF